LTLTFDLETSVIGPTPHPCVRNIDSPRSKAVTASPYRSDTDVA